MMTTQRATVETGTESLLDAAAVGDRNMVELGLSVEPECTFCWEITAENGVTYVVACTRVEDHAVQHVAMAEDGDETYVLAVHPC